MSATNGREKWLHAEMSFHCAFSSNLRIDVYDNCTKSSLNELAYAPSDTQVTNVLFPQADYDARTVIEAAKFLKTI